MRVRYLRLALLAGILAATASADSIRTEFASREERSPRTDRDDIAATNATFGDEDRARSTYRKMTIPKFVREVLLDNTVYQRSVMKGVSKKYATMVEEKISPQENYKKLVGDLSKEPLLTTKSWKMWAFFASKYCAKAGKNPHEYIVEVMLDEYGAGSLSEILAEAVDDVKTKALGKKLQMVLISLWLKNDYQPQKVFNLLQVEDVWEKNIFSSPRFATWIRYLKYLRKAEYARDPVGTEVRSLWEWIDRGQLLKILLLPENASEPRSVQYLKVLKSILLDDTQLPEDVVSMLVEGVKEDEKLPSLFMNKLTRKFWMTYAKEFHEQYSLQGSMCQTLSFAFSLPKLLTMMQLAVNAPDKSIRGLAIWLYKVQFLEWKKFGVTDIRTLLLDLTDISREDQLAIEATQKAYVMYYHTMNAVN